MRKAGAVEVRSSSSLLACSSNKRVHQVVLETEFDNAAALSLYESLGFIREKRLFRFYLNGKDAFRLVLVVPPLPVEEQSKDSGFGSELIAGPDIPLVQRKHISLTRPSIYLAPPTRTFQVPAVPYDSDDEVSGR